MNQPAQEEFVNDLVNKQDQVTGLQLLLNRLIILFYKCLYIRKRKKIVTLVELLLPCIIFLIVINNQEKVMRILNKILCTF